jgi:hypothetical protein
MRKTIYISRMVVFISLSIAVELIGLPQPITGPLVNFMLLLSAMVLGPAAGVVLGIFTPIIAVIRGQLPPALMPMVPFIVIGNALLVSIFIGTKRALNSVIFPRSSLLKSVSPWSGIVLGSLCKFLWLYVSAGFVLPKVLGTNMPPVLVAMMALPQFITALIGGALALIVYSMLKKRYFTAGYF